MELYLDSVDLKEIQTAFELGTLTGLTTTPTFMHREGVKDIDGMMLKLADMVPILQVEALGDNADEIVAEAERLISIGLDPQKTVFKIPVSMEGIKACKRLHDADRMVNIHLVYTLQQAYMAMIAGATYVCPLVGRLQDQGHDALSLVKQCVEMVENYGYPTKIMFSSVRHPEHVRNAINLGVHTITVPWKVMKNLTENNFTTVGTQQFTEHTKLLTLDVKEVIRDANPTVSVLDQVVDATIQMTESGLGAVSVLDEGGKLVGIFTDGDLRRALKEKGKKVMDAKMSNFTYNPPLTVKTTAKLIEAVELIKSKRVDNLIVVNTRKKVVGMLDVQDLVKLNLIG